MESVYLLVIDAAPDAAEECKNLLRNSGINVRVLQASSRSDIERLGREFKPTLMLYSRGAAEVISVGETAHLARELGVLLAVTEGACDSTELAAALETTVCIGLPSGQDATFVSLVRRLTAASHTTSDAAGVLKEKEDLNQRYELLMDSTAEAIAYFHEGLHVYANRAYINMLQADGMDQLGMVSLLEIVRSQDQDIKSLVRGFSQGQFPQGSVPLTIVPPGLDGFDAEVTFRAVRFDGEDCVQAVIRRAGDQASIQAAMDEFHGLDPLTSLKSRDAFMNALQQRMEQQDPEGVSAVLFIEPDGFREKEREVSVFDVDRYLKALGRELNRMIEPTDLLARFSDHAFIIGMERMDRSALREAAQAVRTGFESHFSDGHMAGLPQQCSIGMVMVGPQTLNAEEAVSQARLALDQAAEEGNAVVRYQPARSIPDDGDEDAQWQERIRFAINNEDFYSVQHSIVNLEGESEGLFENRTFLHEDDGDIAPEDFYPVAERHNLASTIDRQVIPGLLRSIAGSGDRHIINLSGNSVHDFSFASWFQRQLKERAVEGSQLILQIPAEAALSNLRAAQRLIEETQALGCAFSLSGFDEKPRTTGLLELLKVQLVKLPTGMATQLRGQADRQTAIKNVVHAASRASAQVMADSVQDSSDMAALWQCGVKLVSGSFLQNASRVSGE